MVDVAEQAALDAARRVVSRDEQPVSYRSFFRIGEGRAFIYSNAFPDGCDRGAYAREARRKDRKDVLE